MLSELIRKMAISGQKESVGAGVWWVGIAWQKQSPSTVLEPGWGFRHSAHP